MITETGGSSKKSFFIFRSSRTQMFLKTGVVRNAAIFTGKHLSWSLFLIATLFQPRPKRHSNTIVFLWILGNFYETAFFVDSRGCFCQFDKVTIQWWASADLLFLIKTKNVGWFLLKRFVDMVRKCYLHITCRNHSNTILLINLQKTKTCPK